VTKFINLTQILDYPDRLEVDIEDKGINSEGAHIFWIKNVWVVTNHTNRKEIGSAEFGDDLTGIKNSCNYYANQHGIPAIFINIRN
jgi:hypothetical protein